jgi:hypothetical protein
MQRHRPIAIGIAVLAAVWLSACTPAGGDEDVVSAGGTRSSTQTTDREETIKKYRDCLTEQGIPLLDQPTDEGLPQIDKEHVTPEKVSAATEKCQAFVPTGGDTERPAQSDIEARQRYAECVREHGVPSYPDPDPQTGAEQMTDEQAAELKNDPKLPAAQEACQSALPSGGKGTVGG